MSKQRVTMEEIHAHLVERARINALNLREMELYENGKRIEVTEKAIEEFEFIGLSTLDFFRGRLWEDAEEAEEVS